MGLRCLGQTPPPLTFADRMSNILSLQWKKQSWSTGIYRNDLNFYIKNPLHPAKANDINPEIEIIVSAGYPACRNDLFGIAELFQYGVMKITLFIRIRKAKEKQLMKKFFILLLAVFFFLTTSLSETYARSQSRVSGYSNDTSGTYVAAHKSTKSKKSKAHKSGKKRKAKSHTNKKSKQSHKKNRSRASQQPIIWN